VGAARVSTLLPHGTVMAKAPKKNAKADEAGGEDGADGAAPKRKLPLKLIGMAAGAILLLGGAGTGAYMYFGHSGHAAERPKEEAAKPPTFVDMPDVLVNLASAGSDRTQYLKLKVVLELPDAALVPKIQPLLPRVADAFQTYLRELRRSDLDGSAGLYRLREELTRRVNVAIAPSRITAVLFKEIVVQ
jgi:flagellar FliL protein